MVHCVTSFLYSSPTGRILRSKSYRPSSLTWPLSSRQQRVPVHLVGQAVPGEADDRNAVLLQPHHVRPLLPQPGGGPLRIGQVGFRVHDGQMVAVEILPGDHVIAEDLAGGRDVAVRSATRCSLVT